MSCLVFSLLVYFWFDLYVGLPLNLVLPLHYWALPVRFISPNVINKYYSLITVLSLLSAQGANARHFRWRLLRYGLNFINLGILSNLEGCKNSNERDETLRDDVTKIRIILCFRKN